MQFTIEERTELFIREGLDPNTARIAAEASFLEPHERTEAQQEALDKADDLIAGNNRKLAAQIDD